MADATAARMPGTVRVRATGMSPNGNNPVLPTAVPIKLSGERSSEELRERN